MIRPNIVLVIAHDCGQHFGCYGAGVATPNIDRIGEQGVRFEQAFCTAPQCSPARASLLTGLYPHRHGLIGLTHRGFRLTPAVARLPGLLTQAGYHTILFGQHHEEPDAHLMGYRRVITGRDRTIRAVLPEFENYLASQPAGPFFACVGFSEAHRPYDIARHPMDDPRQVSVPPWLGSPTKDSKWGPLPDEPAVRGDIAELDGAIRGLDEGVGRIDSALTEANLADDTLLIFTTDHGLPFPGAKGTLLDPGLKVALVARWPGGKPVGFPVGQVVSRLVSTMDLTPTLLAVAGSQPPADVDGRNLLPLFADPNAEWRDHLFAEQTYHAGYDPVRAIRTERYKYIRSFADRPALFAPNVDESPTKAVLVAQGLHRQPRPAEVLFDLDADPLERNNLASSESAAATLADLRRRLATWMEQTNDPLLTGPVPLPPGAKVTPAGAMTPEDFSAADEWRDNR